MNLPTTAAEIRQQIADLQFDKNKIQAQVDAARRGVAERGEYADSAWLTRAEYAMRTKGWRIGLLQKQLGVIAEAEKKERIGKASEEHKTFSGRFMVVARAVLPRAQYDQIIEAVSAQIAADAALPPLESAQAAVTGHADE